MCSAVEISKASRDDRDLTERSHRPNIVSKARWLKGGGRNEPQLRKMRAAN